MTKKIFKSIIIASIITLLSSILFIMGYLYNYFGNIIKDEMKDKLNMEAILVEEDGIDSIKNINIKGYRTTWISKNGKVLYDNSVDLHKQDNHIARPEVKEAIDTGYGFSSRYSDTMLKKRIYYAKKLEDGSILRISRDRATVGLLLINMLEPVWLIILISLIISITLAYRLSKSIVKPIMDLNPEEQIDSDIYDEVAPLILKINRQNKELEQQIDEIQKREEKFNKVIESMQEGLILLDTAENIITLNKKARFIFDVSENKTGEDFLSICHDYEVDKAIKRAIETGYEEVAKRISNRNYQFIISKINHNNDFIGFAIIVLDVTDKSEIERVRREFTANVSHELKTPIQGILGSIELIENNMIEENDKPHFISNIKKETMKLLELINDTINLSLLDENAEIEMKKVNLNEIINDVSTGIKSIAKEKDINVTLNTCDAYIIGNEKILYDIIRNICENGIKYNKETGRLDINLKDNEEKIIIEISDTGIGIKDEDSDRIFERFYRADKSRSGKVSGTGLGLAIVKHGMKFHGGSISVKSKVGIGTTFILEFPKK